MNWDTMPGSWKSHLRGWRFHLHVVGFSRFQWFRKFCGGKWEFWWVDSPVNSAIWHDVQEFSHECGERPPLCRGTPTCEDWSRLPLREPAGRRKEMKLIHKIKNTYRVAETYWIDWRLGVNTRRPGLRPTQLGLPEGSNSYAPVPYRNLKALIKEAKRLGFTRCTFLDLGSGIGRACFYASRFGNFGYTIGVEYSRQLVAEAVDLRYQWRTQKPGPTFCICDASEWEMPGEKTLVFLYNSFGPEQIKKFIETNKDHKDWMLAYANDQHADELWKMGLVAVWRDYNWKLSLWLPMRPLAARGGSGEI